MKRLVTGVFILALTISQLSFADTSPRAELNTNSANARLSPPLSLAGGSRLDLVSPQQWIPLARKLSRHLEKVHDEYSQLFGPIPAVQTTLKLIEAEKFYRQTGAPRWTNAMYYKGEISIPLSLSETVDLENLNRSVKHEYTHAVIHALSDGRCPGWLDEGIAQWAEGAVNPALEPSLREWVIKRQSPISFKFLQGGFTRLANEMVAPAYGESLFASQMAIESFGFRRIGRYLELLREGKPKNDAFTESFGVSEAGFETALNAALSKWARNPKAHLTLH